MFICKKCGKCCRNVGKIKELSDLNRGDGICKYLENNLCSIYKTRPLLCRVDEAYEIIFKNLISKTDYYKLNYEQCEEFMRN